MKYENNIAIFCKTCIRDIKNLELLLQTIEKFNMDNIPSCFSISETEKDVLEPLIYKYNKDAKIFFDEDINKYHYFDAEEDFNNDWIPQQLVKLNLFKTNFARHYIIIDSDCYFIKDFYIHDFLFDENTPYIPLSDHTKAERLTFSLVYHENPDSSAITKFLNRKGKTVVIEMPFVMTSDYMEKFEDFLNKKQVNFLDIINIYPFEMLWYLEFVLANNLAYVPCSAIFMPIHLESQYQILRLLGFDEELFKWNYIGVVMNKGHVKSIKFKPSFIGQHIIKPIIKMHYKLTKNRSDYKKIHKKCNLKWYQRLFSIKNEYRTNGKKYKIITMLGIKIKLYIKKQRG